MNVNKVMKYRVALVSTLFIALSIFMLRVSADTHANGEKNITACAYLTDGAVYQADKPAGIWGTADDGTQITAQLYCDNTMVAENSATASNGAWELTLPGQEGGYITYSIKLLVNGIETAEYTDILFGEVWLAAGQSNMQLKLYDSYGGAEQMKAADDAHLRIFQTVSKPEVNHEENQPAIDIDGSWIMGDTSKVGGVSAVAYNFALSLRSELDVPVAILETSLGSTTIEEWISGTMYYGKIAPLSHASIRGVIWYQGEKNAGSGAYNYASQLDLLKEKWGQAFGYENDTMPFVFTQLAPYSFESSQNQMLLTKMMDQMTTFYQEHEATVAMVTNYDLSLQYTDTLPATQQAVIHPTVKRPIGERMALAAMGLVYGGKEATAPTLSSCEIIDGVAVLTFSHVGDGLTVCDESLGVLGFALGDKNGVWVNATAEIINSNTVFVYSNFMQNPLYVSYAYCDMNTDANLCASNGIPAAPFSTGGSLGLGSRSYLNCDEEVFVVTSFETVGNEVGHGEYQSLWTMAKRSEISFDNSYCVQGTASVKVDYEAGDDEASAGIDLSGANVYSVTDGLENIKTLSVKMSNADRREKAIRLSLVSSDGTTVFSEKQILKAKTKFETLTFDLSTLYLESGVAAPYPEKVCKNMVAICFYIDDEKAGTIWIDDIKLGVDSYWEPDLQAVIDRLGIHKEYVNTVVKDGNSENHVWIIVMIVATVIILSSLVAIVCVILKRKKRSAIKNK